VPLALQEKQQVRAAAADERSQKNRLKRAKKKARRQTTALRFCARSQHAR
jgi:hypothetical protein